MKDKQAIFWTGVVWLGLSYTTALWRFPDVAHLGMSLLFGLGIWDLQGRRPHQPPLRMKGPDALVGGVMVGVLGILTWKFSSFYLLRVTPWLGGLGLVLLGFGRRGLDNYRRELTLLFFLGLPSAIAPLMPDPSPLAAQFGGGILRLFGQDVSFTEGTHLVLPSGAVEVFRGCSGIEYMTYLLGLAVLCLTLFPVPGAGRYWVPLVGVAMGFTVNGFRVALLALLAAQDNRNSFDYWHEGQGSLLFGGLAVILFGLFYSWVLQKGKTNGAKQPSSGS
jgi:cyanoexosortase A